MKHILVLTAIAVVFFMLGNNLLPLTNPDEVFYSLSATEMVQHHTWLVPHLFGHPQFEKPVFLFWLLRASFVVFGHTSFAARFPPALFGWLGCLTLYYFCLIAFRDREKSFLSAYVLISSGLYFAMSRFLFTDMVFSVFVLMALTAFYSGYVRRETRGRALVLFGVCCALAVLTKGLLGIVLPLATVLLFLVLRRDVKFLWVKASGYGLVLFLILASPWYVFMIHRFGDAFIHEFFYNDHIRRILEAEHRHDDTWYFYPLTLVFGMLPWSGALVAAAASRAVRPRRLLTASPAHTFLISWVLAMFVILQCAHSKLTSYILPAMPALAVIIGDYLHNLITSDRRRTFYAMIGLSSVLIIGLSFAAAFFSTGALPLDARYADWLPARPLAIAFLALSLVLVSASFVMARNGRRQLSIYALGLQLPLLLGVCLLGRAHFEDEISSRAVSEYLLKHDNMDNTVLCSKVVVRGVRFYTNKNVAVMDGTFFSPHPIPMLNTDQEIRDFLTQQKTTFAVLRPTQLRKLNQVLDGNFQLVELLETGNSHVVKVTLSTRSP